MDCIGEDTEMQSCNNEVCPVIPYGQGCKLNSDKCEGENIECSRGKCRCTAHHYHDGDTCISKTSIYPSTDRVTIIVGSVSGVIIIILAVFAIFITVLYRRKANKELTRNERPSNPVYYNTDTSEFKVISTAVVKKNVSREGSTNESQYTSLDSDLKDTGSPYDVIKVN
ncbi:uncharacterized protein LOC123523496 [Mercenaria mercenaria]|uniref:uncharacterized protein LOC123523496 n=1 Tax=Mercenaria mercenaria TaxID=6596 RepID=UPI00234F686B|nr:uncharacterized protein LOC123523496 [Mercenaria mercenaria]